MEVDFSKLTRDYRVNPLKRGEMIPKEDLQYLFIEANLTLKQMAKIINRHPNQIGRQCKENHVIKGKEQSKLSLKKEFRTADVTPTINNIDNLMIQKFEDVIIDYQGELFTWDYYIPSKNLYILYNIGEEHGGEPFNSHNAEHWDRVKSWADKAQNMETNKDKNHYANLINTWTVTDVLKRNTIKHNNINCLEFFTENEFMNWFNA
jgi:hypothetical protein